MNKAQQNDELQLENRYLEQVTAFAQKRLSEVVAENQEYKSATSLAYQEMQEYAQNNPQNLRFGDDFEDLAELTQYAQLVAEQGDAQKNTEHTIRELEDLMNSPYFARIDFLFDGDKTAEKIYIGRAMLMDKDTLDVLVYDWRTPVCSVFYRFGVGPASYEAPQGTITGNMELKRQYEIRRGKLLYFFDSDVQIVDKFLRNLLSQNASPVMKTIVETIQKDQDIVIRDIQSDVMMVQGTAGSGKTSIALHRIAYLMYQGLEGRLSANDILILSPNAVFEEYIAHVLPDLGESNVKTMLLEDIFRGILHLQMQSRGQYLEQLLSCQDEHVASVLKSSAAFKGSMAFAKMLDRLVLDLPKNWIDFVDIDYDGQCIAEREVSKSVLCNPKKIAPLGIRLQYLEHEILEKVHKQRFLRIKKLEEFVSGYPQHVVDAEAFVRMLSIRESAVLLRQIRAFTEIDCKAVYQRLFYDKSRFYRLAQGIDLPDDIEEIRRFTLEHLQEDRLWYEDAAALAYLHIQIHSYESFAHIRQLVLDEAQDEHPLHFAIMRALFPKARYTILGDVNQAIGKQADASLFETFSGILDRKKTLFATLEKSFRCTMEIWQFSARFLNPDTLGECFSRNGEEPQIHIAPDTQAMDEMLISEVAACVELGYQSIGLICKTERDAIALHEQLKERLDVRLIKNGSMTSLRGTMIMPVYLAKGLEFDAVLVCDVDGIHYHTEDDKKLLYIASTRALHRLNLFGVNEASPLLSAVTEKGGF